jgi:RluA family pseudouridine synthase
LSLNVLFETDRLIAVSKPAGLPVIPGRGDLKENTLQKEVQRYLNRKPLIVHRIDKATSGIVLFAKDADAQRKLSFMFEGRKVDKTYHAVVSGILRDHGTIDEPLRIFGSGRTGISPDGKPSVTHYKIRKELKGATYLVVKIETGRRHQIRAHLNHIGYPILGDTRYGARSLMQACEAGAELGEHAAPERSERGGPSRTVGGAQRLMLHARYLGFSGFGPKKIEITDEPGEDFLAVVKKHT